MKDFFKHRYQWRGETMIKAFENIENLVEHVVVKTIMNNSDDTIYFKDLQSRFIFNSKAHALQLNESHVSNMIGKSDYDYFPPKFAKIAFENEQRIMKTGEPQIGVVEKWEKPSGEVKWFLSSKYPLYDEDHNIIGIWGTSKDISKLKEAEEQLIILNKQLQEANHRLEILSTRDGLSGLFNHRHFFDTLEFAQSQRVKLIKSGLDSVYSILLIDVDDFKKINDTYGHPFGDKVIVEISNLITSNTRLADICFRTGGDEFAVFLDNTSLQSAIIVAENLRSIISQHLITDGENSVNATVSVGVATCNQTNSVNELVKLADERLYKSKHCGKNRVTSS
jgi:diguanylate cyclase (GGDEF)-like protein/PAS domain S-box-containing protein